MKGLMELLAKSDSGTASGTDSSDSVSKSALDAPEEDMGGFTESASQAMDALKAGDEGAFSDALKACIEMVR